MITVFDKGVWATYRVRFKKMGYYDFSEYETLAMHICLYGNVEQVVNFETDLDPQELVHEAARLVEAATRLLSEMSLTEARKGLDQEVAALKGILNGIEPSG